MNSKIDEKLKKYIETIIRIMAITMVLLICTLIFSTTNRDILQEAAGYYGYKVPGQFIGSIGFIFAGIAGLIYKRSLAISFHNEKGEEPKLKDVVKSSFLIAEGKVAVYWNLGIIAISTWFVMSDLDEIRAIIEVFIK